MHCHICNSTDVSLLDEPFQVYACARCNHECSVLLPERQETYSPEYFREKHKKWFEYPNTALFRRISDTVEAVARTRAEHISFLDIGCGQGDLVRFMQDAKSAAKLFGIDLVQNVAHDIIYYQGDFVSFPFPEQFDVVSGLKVIEHIGDPHGFVRKITSVLKPRGVVIMNTVNAGGMLYSFARLLRRIGVRGPFERLYDKHHLEHYKKTSLRLLFESEGYRVMSHRVHNFPLKALDVPEGSKLLAFVYRMGIACVFLLTARFGGVHQTIVCQKS